MSESRFVSTISEALYPTEADFLDLAKEWWSDVPREISNWVWSAWDRLVERIAAVELPEKPDDLERDLTENLADDLADVIGTMAPVLVRQEPCERRRRARRGRPRQYDIAIAIRHARRVMWPLEAKVLRTDRDTKDYVYTVQNRYLTGLYAPFCSHGMMLGYLVAGEPNRALDRVAADVPCILENFPGFEERWHKISKHVRAMPPGSVIGSEFTCHHLILELAPEEPQYG